MDWKLQTEQYDFAIQVFKLIFMVAASYRSGN